LKTGYQYLLDQLLSGKITGKEKEDLREIIHSSFKNPELEEMLWKHWKGLEDKEFINDEMRWLLLKNRIFSQIDPDLKSPKRVFRVSTISWIDTLIRVAAILFIPLLVGSALFFHRMNERMDQTTASVTMQKVYATPGSRVCFTLPDKTTVWLNSGSTLEFPLNLIQAGQRRVKLTGQGYFKVSHDKVHPFFVETEGMVVQALGTSFDVSGYADDQQISSTLEEGTVALINQSGKEIARLIPGQKAFLDKTTRNLLVKNVETILTTSWKDGKLIFKNTPMADLIRQLERWYNCNIHVDPVLLKSKLLYTATIQDETLGEVLKMIEISTNVKIRIEKREVYICALKDIK
jgi:transmembrane sensor